MWFWLLSSGVVAGVLDEHGYRLVRVEPGTFEMGSSDPPASVYSVGFEGVNPEPTKADFRRYRPHQVTLTRPYAIGVTEVTRELWYAVEHHIERRQTGKVKKLPPKLGACSGPTCPLTGPDYDAVIAWLNLLSAIEGKRRYYTGYGQPHMRLVDPTADGYRLPTEAEWAFAARAGTDHRYAGSETWQEVSAPGASLHPVGTMAPNAWGLHDMAGNAWEWTSDWLAPFRNDPVTDPTGPKEPFVATGLSGQSVPVKVTRGGSVGLGPMTKRRQERLARVVYRNWELPHCNLTVGVGFRIAQNIPVEAVPSDAVEVAPVTPPKEKEPRGEPPALAPLGGSQEMPSGVVKGGTVNAASLRATSVLASQGDHSYAASMAGDRDPATAWVEGKTDAGVGEALTFQAPSRRCTGLSLLNGYQKSASSFRNNTRVRAMAVMVDGVHVANLDLADRPGDQQFAVSTPAGATVTLEIRSVYPGDRWPDTALSEVWQRCE